MDKNITLRFRKNGTFRILMISDLQETVNYDPRALRGLEAMISKTRPDLVVFGGDNADGRHLKTEAELSRYLEIFSRPMEEKKIPWMHVFGNHDYDIDVPAKKQMKMYAACPHCLSKTSPAGVPGVSNYVVPVLSSKSDLPAYAIFAFDTMYKLNSPKAGVPVEDILLEGNEPWTRKWDTLTFDQIAWYRRESKKLEKAAGGVVRAMAVMHVPPYEFQRVIDNPEKCRLEGFADQKLQCSMFNSGVFSAMLERGDVEIIAAGHLHRDNFAGEYAGILCTLDGCAGFSVKNFDERRGGRLFVINEKGGRKTEFISAAALLEEKE